MLTQQTINQLNEYKTATTGVLTVDDLAVSQVEQALSVIIDLNNRIEGYTLWDMGNATGVKRNIEGVLNVCEDMALMGAVPAVYLFHNHPCGSLVPSSEDEILHSDYKDKIEGRDFIYCGGYIVVPSGEQHKIN